MANPERGEFDLVVNGKTYTLTLKTAGLMALQKHFSTPESVADLTDIFRQVEAGSVEHQVAMLWACLRKYHPEVTFDQAIDWLDDASGLGAVMALFDDVGASTRPDPRDIDELPKTRPQKARAQRRGTGESGTSSRAGSA